MAMESTPTKSGRRVLGDLTVNVGTPSKLKGASIEGKQALLSGQDTKAYINPPFKPVAGKKRGIDEANGAHVAEGHRGSTATVKTREIEPVAQVQRRSKPDGGNTSVEVLSPDPLNIMAYLLTCQRVTGDARPQRF